MFLYELCKRTLGRFAVQTDGRSELPTHRRAGNQINLLAGILAHNLNREMQMRCHDPHRNTTEKCAPLWQFERLATLRRQIIQRAGRLTRPHRTLTLTMTVNQSVKSKLLHYLQALSPAV